MRRHLYVLVAAAVVAVAALSIGLAVASAQEDAVLPSLTPTELMTAMAEKAPQVAAVSGEFSWSNGLFGTTVFQSFHGGGSGSGDPGLDLLMGSGSGRLWLQGDAARLESQGLDGDTAVYYDGTSLWVYDSGADTATEYVLPAVSEGSDGAASAGWKHSGGAAAAGAAGADTAALDLPARIQEAVDELAPTASLAVSQGEDVAGRASYQLTMTPTAANTVVGSAVVAVDGETFMPLRLQVFAKGSTDPVISAGFTSVSYDPVDESVFAFTPPADAAVEQKAVELPDPADATAKAEGHPAVEGDHEPLTLAGAEAEAGFPLMTPADETLPFRGAYVIPAHDVPEGAFQAGAFSGTTGEAADDQAGDALAGLADTIPGGLPTSIGPVAILAYGDGFGTVMLLQVENEAGAAGWAALGAALGQVPFVGQPVQVGDSEAYVFDTALGSAMLWQRDGRVLMASGMISRADLAAFAASVR